MSAMSFSALSALVTDLVPDTGARLKPGALHRARWRAARVQYSKDRPTAQLEDVTTVAGNPPAAAGRLGGGVGAHEHRIPAGQFPPVFLGPAEFGLLSAPSGDEIGLLTAVPAGEVLRVRLYGAAWAHRDPRHLHDPRRAL